MHPGGTRPWTAVKDTFDAWYTTLDTCHLIPSYLILGTWCLMPDTWFLDTWYLIPDTWLILDTWYLIQNIILALIGLVQDKHSTTPYRGGHCVLKTPYMGAHCDWNPWPKILYYLRLAWSGTNIQQRITGGPLCFENAIQGMGPLCLDPMVQNTTLH